MSVHVEHKMHRHSLKAFDEDRYAKFSPRESQILRLLDTLGCMTDRDVMQRLGFSDMNAVRPRITELKKAGYVEEVGEQEDPITRKIVRVIQSCEPKPLQAELCL